MQFQTSPNVRLPLPKVVTWLFALRARPLVLPERFTTSFLYHHHSALRVAFSRSPKVALHCRLELMFAINGLIIGPVMYSVLNPLWGKWLVPLGARFPVLRVRKRKNSENNSARCRKRSYGGDGEKGCQKGCGFTMYYEEMCARWAAPREEMVER